MPSYTKTKLLLISILTLLFIVPTQAQWGAPTTISTPRGNVTLPGNYNHSTFSFNSKGPVNRKYDFHIVLLNDSTIIKKTKLDVNFATNHVNITWKEKKGNQKKKYTITAKETKEIYRIVNNETKIQGLPLDSTWVFLVDTGALKTYSITSDIKEPTLAYFQYAPEGKIQAISKDNLRPLVIDDPEILKLVNKNRLLKAIKKYNEKAKNTKTDAIQK